MLICLDKVPMYIYVDPKDIFCSKIFNSINCKIKASLNQCRLKVIQNLNQYWF